MSGERDSRTDIFEDESLRLKDALKSCRKVVANYRVMLSGEESEENPGDPDGEDEKRTD
ncbi:hypothetical protein [Sphingomonas sp. URHD0057]|uniref:hypothetical protein n=1 Tax=Sphingomonas sp. URHD0057 TaxID=1380389 RepID=UPI000AF502C1|nr:hypothetical protein [Sphingomonas sp. URHD0057]